MAMRGSDLRYDGDCDRMVLCCLCGIGSSTPLWQFEAILVLTNATSGLYPIFHRTLSKDLGSFALWIRDMLEAFVHASTRSQLQSF